jgi:molybdopterin-guanine dinucleotide biosynthesis protein MobB
MANIIRFIGSSGSGKTTLIAGVVHALAERGLAASVIKHAHHDVELDVSGKDSFVFTEAGARASLVASWEKLALIETIIDEP